MLRKNRKGFVLSGFATYFIIGVLGSAAFSIHAQHSLNAEGQPLLPPEQLDQPPSTIVDRDQLDRSPAAKVSAGPYISVQVNVDEFGNNIVGDAANEPSIATNPIVPGNFVIGWRQFDTISSNFRQAGWAYTLDDGQTWTFPGSLTPGVFRSDPVLAADADGNFYYQSLTESFLMDVFTSVDGGISWGPPVPSFGGDKNWMAIDTTAGIGRGNVYGIWQRFFGCCGSNDFTRSIDGAQSFQTPVPADFHPTFGTMAVGPAGVVYATGIDGRFTQDFTTFVVSRSNNAQNPLATPTFNGQVVNMGGSMRISAGPNPGGLLGQANIAIDHSTGPTAGNLYVLASVNPPGTDPLDVHLISSSDGGASWSAPVRINNDPIGNGAWQWFGAHSVAPNGRIDVIWNDTRNSGQTNISELFYAYSYDAGVSWHGNIPVSPPFDSSLGYPNQNKLGDYYTLISDDSGAHVAYSATFNGEQDLYYLYAFPDCNDNGTSDVDDINGGFSQDNNANLLPDECELILNEPVPGQAGQINTISVSMATPGSQIGFIGSLLDGLTFYANCDDNFDMANPRLLGVAVADGAGDASVDVSAPASLAGQTVFLQAVELPSCIISSRIEFDF